MSTAQTYDAAGFPAWPLEADDAHAYLVGLPLGRRERGPHQVEADMTIAEVVEPAQDLAVADRVAFVRARLTGRTHAVVATTHTYVVVRADHELEGTDASELRQPAGAPRLISIATPDYVTPALAPLVAQFGHHCTTTVPSQHTSQN